MNIEELYKKKEIIERIAALYGAKDVRIFGSVARNEQNIHSDLDILVKLDKGTTLLKHLALIHALEEELGVKVDVVSEGSLKGRIKENILREVIRL